MRYLLSIFTIGVLGLTLLSACAPAGANEPPDATDVAELIPTELSAPSFVPDLLTALGKELQIDPTEFKLVSVEKVQWRDSCLGVEREGMMCLEVITPGYLIVFETPKGIYEAHTNDDGSAFLFVPQQDNPTETPGLNTDS